MDREILFRGKRTDNGEWVYGYYTELPVGSIGATIFSNDDEIVCEDTASYIIKVFAKQHSNYYGNPLQVIECENYEVITETVGQYTGLTDKNGNRIFEGDIVKYGDTVHNVVFEQRNGTAYFGLVYSTLETLSFGHYQDLKQIEVIGNIHDDSDLLEVSE